MNHTKIFAGLILIFTLFSCAPKAADESSSSDYGMAADSTVFASSSAAVENKKDSTHKFIRTADLKFKVKSVIRSTYNIEDLTARQGGFVTYTNLKSDIGFTEVKAISADSSLETTHFTVTNEMIIQVPNTKLDTTLKEIAKNIDFLDYRIIKADDVALQIMANKLTQNRSTKNEARITRAIDNRGKKLNETTVAEEILLSKQEQADNARIANLSLQDQLNFSTINITIYQRQTIKRELIANDRNIDEYEPGFGRKIVEALKTGWVILEAIVIFLLNLWGIYVLALIGYLLYKIYVIKFGKK